MASPLRKPVTTRGGTFKFLTAEEEKHFHLLQTWLLKGFLTRIRSSDRGKEVRDVCHEHWRTSCEKNSLEFYPKAAQDASDPTEKRVFQELTAWETRHHQMLVKELKSLQEVYWTTNRFAPF